MPKNLKRYYGRGEIHFVTFSCYRRIPLLRTIEARNVFVEALGAIRDRYKFSLVGYVVMPEHVHLLLSEPDKALLRVALQALKISVSKRAKERPFWQARYYDFNVFTWSKRSEKLDYIHWNPVKHGLVEKPEDWLWSSCRYYQTGVQGRVKISW